MAGIFDRQRLTPAQLRSVAQRRFDDAQCLRRTKENARANGVFYLGGFVIECLLKAQLLRRFPVMEKAISPHGMSKQDQQVWSLIYRSHDLQEMLEHLPDLQRQLAVADSKHGTQRLDRLKLICEQWTIFARYSPLTSEMKEAAAFLDRIKDLKEWLR